MKSGNPGFALPTNTTMNFAAAMSGFDPPWSPRLLRGIPRRWKEASCAPADFTLCSVHIAMDDVLDEKVVVPVRSPSEDDRRLILRLLVGNPQAVATLDAWIHTVLRTEFHSLHGEWDDLRQEVRMRVFRNLRAGRFQGASELRTYVHRIARNTCIDQWRRAAARRDAPDDATIDRRIAGKDEATERLISRDLLRKILLGSTPEERHLIHMVHTEHLSYAEIARRLGVAEGTIKARVFRCRDRLLALRRRLLRIGDR